MLFALVNLLLFDRTTGCANLALPPLSFQQQVQLKPYHVNVTSDLQMQ